MRNGLKRSGRLLCLLLVISLLTVQAGAVGEAQSYSYHYDQYCNPLPAPSPYQTRYRIDPADLGAGKLRAATGMFVRDDMLYLCDTGNDRVLQLRLDETGASLVREFSSGEGWSLSAPADIFAGEDGTLYIADSGNGRVLVLDASLKLLHSIGKPESAAFDSAVSFSPQKLAVTAGGRIYVQAAGVNRGLLEFSAEGEFDGYMGASPVRFDWSDYIWKRISTDAQQAQMEQFVPTEYNNLCVDDEGFLFVTTSVFSESDLMSGAANPVRRLNLKGTNILIENWEPVIGAYSWDKLGPSRFVDVTALVNGIYYVLDSTYNRIFAYDTQGNPLYTFGGYGTREGYFRTPKALEHWGNDLLVLDSASGYVTVMALTEYGGFITQAIECYDTGRYDEAYAAWENVLRRNGNYLFAYDGIGKILLRKGEYKQALDYLEYARDEYYYSKAWQFYRKEWIEDSLIYFVVGIASVLVIYGAVRWLRRQKEALENYDEP